MTDTERINELLKYTNLNGRAFAYRIGLKYPDTVYHILRGRNGISNRLAERIRMAFPEIDRQWLLLGEGEMMSRDQKCIQNNDTATHDNQIPLYDLAAASGLSYIFDGGAKPVDHIKIPNSMRCDGAIYIHGDSMEPLFRSGDIAVYKKIGNTRSILWGEMYLLSFTYNNEEYTTIKYITKGHDDEHVSLSVRNTTTAPIEIPISSILTLAITKASIRIFTMS